MKLVLFESRESDARPGVLTAGGAVDIAGVVPRGHTPPLTMQGIIGEGGARWHR